MHLFQTNGASATPLSKTSLAALGLRERQDLQEWVIAHPEVMGEDLLVITSEYDRWRGTDGVTSKDRLDVLALESSGRLAVAELKRSEDRDVHLQAINYAALVSTFNLDTLAEAYAAFLTSRGTQVDVDTARERLQEHVEDWNDETLRSPRIVLIAGTFPRIVTHTAVWLSKLGLDITLVQVSLWVAGSQVIGSFERLYPVPATEEFTLAPARQEAAAAKALVEERSRRGRSLDRLVAAGALEVGTVLTVVPDTRITAQESQAVRSWVAEQPARGRAVFNGDGQAGLTWQFDDTTWSPTGLAKHIVKLATGREAKVIGGPRWWATPAGVTLRDLADSIDGDRGQFDWTRLHEILERVAPGSWTTYGDLAAVIGTSPQPLGNHVTRCQECANAWRVLGHDGRVAGGFIWNDPDKTDDPEDVLAAEGVRLVDGRADATQRLSRDDLDALAPGR